MRLREKKIDIYIFDRFRQNSNEKKRIQKRPEDIENAEIRERSFPRSRDSASLTISNCSTVISILKIDYGFSIYFWQRYLDTI